MVNGKVLLVCSMIFCWANAHDTINMAIIKEGEMIQLTDVDSDGFGSRLAEQISGFMKTVIKPEDSDSSCVLMFSDDDEYDATLAKRNKLIRLLTVVTKDSPGIRRMASIILIKFKTSNAYNRKILYDRIYGVKFVVPTKNELLSIANQPDTDFHGQKLIYQHAYKQFKRVLKREKGEVAEYVRMMFVSPIGRREIDAHYEDVASSSLTEAVANIINPIVSNTQSHKVTRIFIVQVDAVLYRLIILGKFQLLDKFYSNIAENLQLTEVVVIFVMFDCADDITRDIFAWQIRQGAINSIPEKAGQNLDEDVSEMIFGRLGTAKGMRQNVVLKECSALADRNY